MRAILPADHASSLLLLLGLALTPCAGAQGRSGQRRTGGRSGSGAAVVDSPPAARRSIARAHSRISFEATSKFHAANGRFERWNADVRLDTARLERGSIQVVVEAASLTTSEDARDEELRGKDFLWADRYPEIRFTSTRINRLPDGALHVMGDLDLRGVRRAVVVPVALAFDDAGRGHLTGMLSLSRRDFGMVYDNPANPIADEVRVKFEIVLEEPATAKP